MVCPDRFHFGTVSHNNQHAIAVDPAQQALDERLCGRVAPVRVLQQEQDGGASSGVTRNASRISRVALLRCAAVISACDKVSCVRNSNNSAMSRRAWRVGPSAAFQHALDALEVFRIAQIPPQIELMT